MDNINKSSADAYETYQVGRRSYRRVKPDYVSTKVARRVAYQAPAACTLTLLPPYFSLRMTANRFCYPF